ncbi:hypothetical protein C3492_35315 [Streptomyces sp. Ru62]|uniref:hypothetical protein n=1 Tax=Streptomyces sp. Ru62 TaxID=2080745 RepID=UPI000CDD91B0|nr:hypothetical protein [Streptomyces sp. Ru62]POX58810.1 hypothetical protein C3492_35315 [Streptomyces sp. Ru62]
MTGFHQNLSDDRAITAPLTQLRAAGVHCLPGWDRSAEYVAVPLADGATLRFTGTTLPDDDGMSDDVSIEHPVRAHESWRAEVAHPVDGTTELYDSADRPLPFDQDTAALVAAILQRLPRHGGSVPAEDPAEAGNAQSGD